MKMLRRKTEKNLVCREKAELCAACAASCAALLAYMIFLCAVKNTGYAPVGIAAVSMLLCGGAYAFASRFIDL